MTVERITYPASVEGGGTRRVSVLLDNPTFTERALPDGTRGLTVTGEEVDRDGDRTDRLHVILATPGEVKRTPYVTDLFYGTLVPANRESAPSKAMRANR